MKALIIVGGHGTRLRPLTLTQPKPLIQFANKPIITHQIEALSKAGVTKVILAINYRSEMLEQEITKQASIFGIKVFICNKKEPLGTACPLALAKDLLMGNEPFFVLNSDIICNFPFIAMLVFHKSHGHDGTILVTKVEAPCKCGVVAFDKARCTEWFAKKSPEYIGNEINAGLYIFNPSILKHVPDPSAQIGKDCQIGPNVVVGPNVVIEDGVCLKQSTVLANSIIRSNSWISSSIIGRKCDIGNWVRIENMCVLGEDIVIKDGLYLNGAHVLPHKNISASVPKPNIIM